MMMAKAKKATEKTARRSRGSRLKALLTDREFLIPVISAIATVVVFVLGVIFIPRLLATPIASADYKLISEACKSDTALLEEVRNHNFNFGGDAKLAVKLTSALQNADVEPGCYYFDALATAEYYYGIHEYDRAIYMAKEANDYSTGGDAWAEVVQLLIKAYGKQGNTEQVAYWQGLLDEYNTEPADCDDGEEETEASE